MADLHRIMFVGSAGQVGQAFKHVWDATTHKPLWEVGMFNKQALDITNPAELRNLFLNYQPDLVINAAAFTQVDLAEKNEAEATSVNFHAVAHLAAQCSARDIPMIHLSTDYVFDGTEGVPYKPDDPMNPLNVYGATKMMGEEAVRHELAWHVILRVSWVFSAFRQNILTNTLKMIETHDALRIVTDMTGNPTPATDIARALITIGEQILGGKTDGFGTFHLCGAPSCSRYELTQAIMDAYAPHTQRRPSIAPALRADFPGAAQRPPYSVLDCEKIKRVYGIEQRPWREGLDEAIDLLFKGGRTPL